jgi:hypothetical protein
MLSELWNNCCVDDRSMLANSVTCVEDSPKQPMRHKAMPDLTLPLHAVVLVLHTVKVLSVLWNYCCVDYRSMLATSVNYVEDSPKQPMRHKAIPDRKSYLAMQLS